VTGRHAGPPHGSAARDTTASPYTGRHERPIDPAWSGMRAAEHELASWFGVCGCPPEREPFGEWPGEPDVTPRHEVGDGDQAVPDGAA